MAKLPVYNSKGSITTDTPNNIRRPQDYQLWGDTLEGVSKEITKLSAEWQQAKDQVENLDGKNKLLMGISDVLTEAQDFNSWNSPEELEAKKQELKAKMQNLLPNVMDGFSNNQNAVMFQKQGEFTTFQNQVKLDEIFRNKYQDLNDSNIQLSYDTNFSNYISTGDANYKDSFLNDIQTSVNAGFMTKEEATRLTQKTDKWGVYHVLNLAETNPDAAIKALKSGQYGVKPEDYHDTLKSLTSIKTNQKLLQEYQERVKQDNFESEALNYVTSNNTYADKVRYIDEAELNGNISENYAARLRRGIRSENPNKQKSVSEATAVSDILQQAYDLNSDDIDNDEYLTGIKNVRDNILSLQEQGLISTKDANSLNRQIDTATRKKISEATSGITFNTGWKDAKAYINDTLPPEQRAMAIREVFYATQNINTEQMTKAEVSKQYKEAAVNAVANLNQSNRQRALQVKNNPKTVKKQSSQYAEGTIIRNPKTGQRMELKGGQWQVIK